MREWLTASEIAELALPDLPDTKRGIAALTAREGWDEKPFLARERRGHGGGIEYNISLLPTIARVEYERRYRRIGMEPDAPIAEETTESFAPVSERAAIERDARLAILSAYESFLRGLSLGRATAAHVFASKYNARTLSIDEWVVETVPKLSPRTLARWRAARRHNAIDRLAVDRSGARKGKGVLDTAEGGRVRDFILARLAEQPLYTAQHIQGLLRSEFGDTLSTPAGPVALPPLRTIQHFLKIVRESHVVVLAKVSHPDLYRSRYAPAGIGTHRDVVRPNGLWQIDASPVDAICTDGRQSIYVCLDIATRRAITFVSATPRAAAVALLIRKAILAWGVPEKIVTDNGSDFVARDVQRLFAVLGIEAERSDPYAPQQKGHVERVIKTFQHDCARLLPGFVGHSVADRKRIENRKAFAARLGESDTDVFGVSLSGADLQTRADEWFEVVYQHRPHAGLGGRTPFEAMAASGAAVRRIDERALDILLMPVAGKDGRRKVTKLGIQVEGYHYVCNAVLPGDFVFVRLDPTDLGQVYVFDEAGGRYLGPGVCPELAGIHPATVMQVRREEQAKLLEDAARRIAEEKRRFARGPAPIDRILEVARRDVPNIVALPRREEQHSTPEIAAALDAAGAPRDRMADAVETGEREASATVIAFRPEPAPGERPRFRDDVEYAAWLLANPAALAPHDRIHLKDRLRSWTFRQLLGTAGVPVEAVQTLISTTSNEVSA